MTDSTKPDVATLDRLRAEALAVIDGDSSHDRYALMLELQRCAHKHLKDADFVISCFDCGHYFFKGHDITEVDGDE